MGRRKEGGENLNDKKKKKKKTQNGSFDFKRIEIYFNVRRKKLAEKRRRDDDKAKDRPSLENGDGRQNNF